MKKEIIEIFTCDYCGFQHKDENFMRDHEELCFKNPKNLPCSECENNIIGAGCAKNMDMEKINSDTLCFFYKKGTPKSILDIIK